MFWGSIAKVNYVKHALKKLPTQLSVYSTVACSLQYPFSPGEGV